jgi:hypothetical protein
LFEPIRDRGFPLVLCLSDIGGSFPNPCPRIAMESKIKKPTQRNKKASTVFARTKVPSLPVGWSATLKIRFFTSKAAVCPSTPGASTSTRTQPEKQKPGPLKKAVRV